MYTIIFAYILGVIVEVIFGSDLYFLFLILLVSVALLYFHKRHKGHLKDMVIFITIFSLATVYTDQQIKSVSYVNVPEGIYEVTGKVKTVKHTSMGGQLEIEVGEAMSLDTNVQAKHFPKLVTVNVSPFNKFEMYETIKVVGEVEFQNFNTYNEKLPLYFNYEFMKLDSTTNYNVSHPKNIYVISKNRNFYETALLLFHATSEDIKEKINEHMSAPYGSIAEGISLGQQDNLTKDIKDIFRSSGLIHILVLSGANVAFIISIFWYLLRRVRNKNLKVSVTIIFSWIFIFITGTTPPSVRAGVMSSLNILGEYFGRNISSLYSLLFSLFILGLISPLSLIYSPSLHLSFLACFGLFIIAPKLEKYLHFFVATFIGIFVSVTPYILALTGVSSLFGTLLTFIVEPFVLLSTVLSFLIIIFSYLNFYVADFFGILNSLSVKFILFIATWSSQQLPQIFFQISKNELLIYYTFLFLIFAFDWDGIIKKNES